MTAQTPISLVREGERTDSRNTSRAFGRAVAIGTLAGGCAGLAMSALIPGVITALGPGVLVVGFAGGMLWGAMAGTWFGFPSAAIARTYHDRIPERETRREVTTAAEPMTRAA